MAEQTRLHDADFFLSILNSVDQEVSVIDRAGNIVFVNDAWVRFGAANGAQSNWLGANYLATCTPEGRFRDTGAEEILMGLRRVLDGAQERFEHEYPCHSPDERRWFMMAATRLRDSPRELFVITHTNITERKLMEERMEALSLRDDLTGLANRRKFRQFFRAEWHRNQRDRTPVSLAIFDLDHFKKLNDRYGHLAGDRCIRNAATLIGSFAQRASDLAVRWGGEEFILLMGNTPLERATQVAEKVRLRMQEATDAEYGRCTLSTGVATLTPADGDGDALIRMADTALYEAKSAGRNRVVPYAPRRHA